MLTSARILVVLLLSGGVMAAQAAGAVTRFASPTGSTTTLSECTNQAAPCSLTIALDHPGAGDTISLAGGLYDVSAIALPPVPLHWVATDPAARPSLTSSGATATMSIGSAQSGTVIEGVDLSNTHVPSDVPALSVGAGTTFTVRGATVQGGSCIDAPDTGPLLVEDSTLTSRLTSTCMVLGAQATVRRSTVGRATGLIFGTPAPSVITQGTIEDSTVTGGLQLLSGSAVARRVRALAQTAIWGQGLVVNSLAQSIAADGVAIAADAPVGGTLRVVNVTAIAPKGVALLARPVRSNNPQIGPNLLDVTNSIARGGVVDVQATAGVTCQIGQHCDFGFVHIDHSNFVTRDPVTTSVLAAAILEGAGNQSGDPRFASAAALDFHPLAGSPVIDAGVSVPEALPTDLDGRPRAQGPAPDIGAFERDVPVTTPPPTTTTTSGGTAADTTAPVLGPLRLSRARLRVLSASLSRTGHRVLTRSLLTTSVNEAARVTITVQRAVAGTRAGRRCITSPRRRAGKRCTRWVSVKPVSIVKATAAGPVTLRFSAQRGRRLLGGGRYRLRVQATDAAGNVSEPRVIGFRVVRV